VQSFFEISVTRGCFILVGRSQGIVLTKIIHPCKNEKHLILEISRLAIPIGWGNATLKEVEL
jgi:hypothetical protein